MELKPLKSDVGQVVNDFLDDPDYYKRFKAIAKNRGVTSENPDVIKQSMFKVEDNHIGFANTHLEELFLEWQVFKEIKDIEPYSTVLRLKPERKPLIIKLAKRILNNEEINEDDVVELFKDID